jgi:RNA polymerase sigma-70 factor (ECF subfamily)
MSVAEVAVALAVPAGTVKTRLMHARHKLRAALEGDE